MGPPCQPVSREPVGGPAGDDATSQGPQATSRGLRLLKEMAARNLQHLKTVVRSDLVLQICHYGSNLDWNEVGGPIDRDFAPAPD